jgi:short-subunit dehydrogenase involved in D-alanine esterification of teichoic acids
MWEDAIETIDTNYYSTVYVTEKFLPLLRASPNGARIVMISSSRGQLEVNSIDFLFIDVTAHQILQPLKTVFQNI